MPVKKDPKFKATNKKKAGRKIKAFTNQEWDQIEKLIGFGFTQEELCATYNVTIKTLTARIKEKYNCNYSNLHKKYYGKVKVSARRSLIMKAQAGDTTAIIFLNKITGAMEEDKKQSIELKKQSQKEESKLKEAQRKSIELKNALLQRAIEKLDGEEAENMDDHSIEELEAIIARGMHD